MDRSVELPQIRRDYARQLLVIAGVDDPSVEKAFAKVPREHFLGPGPWSLGNDEGAYSQTPDRDPVHLYTDRVISICKRPNLTALTVRI
jgi:protein-L-isoaspartate(D-aspartate) O-methyltransferase